MTANRIIQHIFQQPGIQQVEESALEQLVSRYPYFTAARLLLGRKQYQQHRNLLAPAVKEAQLYSNDLHYFYRFITTEEPAGAPAAAVEAAPAEIPEQEAVHKIIIVEEPAFEGIAEEDEDDDWDADVQPAAAEATGTETAAAEAPAETAGQETDPAATDEEAPIKIFPLEIPEEETTLTFQPLYTDDYFAYKRLKEPGQAEELNEKGMAEMKSFTAWLRDLKHTFSEKASKDWYHQQLHRSYEDVDPEVSEVVEKMAMESITFSDDIISETLAEIWARQHQYQTAIQIYQKLSLLNPDKSAYFAQKIKDLQLLTEKN